MRRRVGQRVWLRDANGARISGRITHVDAGANDGTGRVGVLVEPDGEPGDKYWRPYDAIRAVRS